MVFGVQEVPLKANEEFECKLNLSFKTPNGVGQPSANYVESMDERNKRFSGSSLPYLKITLSFLVLTPDEVRIQVTGGGDILKNKKIEVGEEVDLELGFTADIKDGILPRDYVVLLLRKDRKPVSKIIINFTEQGDYLVNGVKRGRI